VRGLQGARMLVIGLGAVGQAIAADAAVFGMDVWGMRHRSEGPLPQGVSRMIAKSELRAALGHIDALVLACPLTAETRLLLDRPEIAALKPGGVVVNVARGAVIHEEALAE